MAFMMKKKRYKFQADLCLDELTEVSYSKAILFAKIRQLDGGSFTDVSRRYVIKKCWDNRTCGPQSFETP